MKKIVLFILFIINSCQKKMEIEGFYEGDELLFANAILEENIHDIQDILKQKRIDINSLGLKNVPFLMFAAINNKKGSFEELLRLKADPNIKIYDNPKDPKKYNYYQLLPKLVKIKDFDYAKLLLKYGANPDGVSYGQHSFFSLVFLKDIDESFNRVKYLIEKGADINVEYYEGVEGGKTLICLYAGLNNFNFVEELLDLGADPLKTNNTGMNLCYYVQKTESNYLDIQQKIKRNLLSKGIEFPILNIALNKELQAKYDFWFRSDEGKTWKNKLIEFSKDWKIVGKEWNLQQDSMKKDMNIWLKK